MASCSPLQIHKGTSLSQILSLIAKYVIGVCLAGTLLLLVLSTLTKQETENVVVDCTGISL